MKLIVKAVLKLVMRLISLLLLPIDTLINQHLPALASALDSVSDFLTWLTTFAKWVLSWLPLGTQFYAFLIAVLVFRFTFPLLVEIVKLAIKWYHYLVP